MNISNFYVIHQHKKPQDTTVKTNFCQRKRYNQKLSPSKNSSSFSILGMMLELII